MAFIIHPMGLASKPPFKKVNSAGVLIIDEEGVQDTTFIDVEFDELPKTLDSFFTLLESKNLWQFSQQMENMLSFCDAEDLAMFCLAFNPQDKMDEQEQLRRIRSLLKVKQRS